MSAWSWSATTASSALDRRQSALQQPIHLILWYVLRLYDHLVSLSADIKTIRCLGNSGPEISDGSLRTSGGAPNVPVNLVLTTSVGPVSVTFNGLALRLTGGSPPAPTVRYGDA